MPYGENSVTVLLAGEGAAFWSPPTDTKMSCRGGGNGFGIGVGLGDGTGPAGTGRAWANETKIVQEDALELFTASNDLKPISSESPMITLPSG